MNSENKIEEIKQARINGNFPHAKKLASIELENSNDGAYRVCSAYAYLDHNFAKLR